MKKQFLLSTVLMVLDGFVQAQILEVNPAFPTVNDVVTITYDATQGNAALVGQNQIYAHAGLITSASTSPTNWQFVQGNWGTVDPEVVMTNIGNNKHTITIDIDQYYGFPVSTNVLKFAFVFRNAAGTVVGRSADGSDIYYDVYPINAGLLAQFFHPNTGSILDVNEQLQVEAAANQNATLTLKQDGNVLQTIANATQLTYSLTATQAGTHLLEFIADNGTTQVIDSTYFTVNPLVVAQDPTYANLQNGINYINDTTVVLQLFAPQKEHIYVIGDFNNWTPAISSHMNLATNNQTWWLEITGLTPGQKYAYQYLIDGNLRLADPMSSLILDPNNDNSINAQTYPNSHPYPVGQTTGFVTVLQTAALPYNWSSTNFIAPEKKDLVIYELHVRDFIAKRNYQTLIDTLDYLSKLGINAIELMPPGEFENNESWGYNPSFHMALDKYYGTPEKFKEFIDSCHGRGIAVIVDMVLNHAFGQSPMVNMYWDAANARPAANSPWFNAICPHEPYCWGYDYDHTRLATQQYIDQINRYWVETYNIDGFRFDYTKGFINNANGYSMERINLLKRMADDIWTYKSDAYIILEHWCDNAEEEQLADYGMLLWGNVTHGYQQALMGFTNSSNISSGIYTNRGWSVPHLISYAESHDEERTMFEALTYGNNTNAAHNARNLYTALGRAQGIAVILLTQPGPKMLWQFQELGYDISIDNPCRVCNKPILWNYYTQVRRRQLYDVYAAILALRNNHETFRSLNFQYSLTGAVKRVNMNHSSMNGVSMANFAVSSQSIIPAFQHAGWWYEYFSGDSINVTNALAPISLNAGAYRIYTDVKLAQPEITDAPASIEEVLNSTFELKVFPNPSSQTTTIGFQSNSIEPYTILLINEAGQIALQKKGSTTIGKNEIQLSVHELSSGNYHFLVKVGSAMANKGFVKVD